MSRRALFGLGAGAVAATWAKPVKMIPFEFTETSVYLVGLDFGRQPAMVVLGMQFPEEFKLNSGGRATIAQWYRDSEFSNVELGEIEVDLKG